MARLKQLEPKKETIGGLNFYIRPFPAMVAANLTGDLASLLTPVLAALMPLVGDSDNEGDDEDGDLMDIDVNDAAASISKSMEGFSGSKVESMMKKLLIAHKNVVVELPVMDEDDVETGEYSQEILDMDIVNEIFCGDVQDMFILAFYVIRLNFNGFFKETRRPIWESRRGYSEEDEEDIVKYGKLDTSQFSELELRMYILIKAKLASMFELKEYYTLDEALKLYALYRMDMDIQNGKAEEMRERRE